MDGTAILTKERETAKQWGVNPEEILDFLNGSKSITKRKAELAEIIAKNPAFNLVGFLEFNFVV